MKPLRNRGVPDHLKQTMPASKQGGIPSSAEPTIKGMQTAAQDGTTAGADDETIRHPSGSQRKNIPGGVGDLIAPNTYHVP